MSYEDDKVSLTVDSEETELYIKINHKQLKVGLCYLLSALTGFLGLFGINTAFLVRKPEQAPTEVIK
jgi:hypothetical protein